MSKSRTAKILAGVVASTYTAGMIVAPSVSAIPKKECNTVLVKPEGNAKKLDKTDAVKKDSVLVKQSNDKKTENENVISKASSKELLLENSSIQIVNGWGTPAGLIKFDAKTMSFNVSEYNQFLGHNSNTFLTLEVYNPSTAQFVYSKSFDGNENTSALSSFLSGKKFANGDVIGISYDGTQGKVEVNNNNTNEMNTSGKMEYFEITSSGLVKSQLEKVSVNPLYILGSGVSKVAQASLTGKANPNEEVMAIIGDNTYSAMANSSGDFSINIKDSVGFTTKTKIDVYAKNKGITTLYPTMEAGVNLENSKLSLIDHWGKSTVNMSFNPVTMQMNTHKNYDSLYMNSATDINISLYSNKTGAKLNSIDVTSGTTQAEYESAFNNKAFAYGDILKITTNDASRGIPEISNSTTNIHLNSNSESYKITKAGLAPYTPSIVVNPFGILGTSDLLQGTLTGKASPNEEVIATIGTQKYSAMANSTGDFSINVKDSTGFTKDTKIEVFGSNEGSITVSPIMASGVEIQNSAININNVWNQYIGTVKFNALTQKMEFNKGGAVINPYLSSKSEAFGIDMYNSNGKLLNSTKVYGDNYPESQLFEFFNNTPYEYGDIIRINYLTSSKLTLSNFNNQKSYRVTGDVQFKIEKGGLISSNLQKTQINPFEILGTSNTAPTSGILTGSTLKPNSSITVTVGSKEFTEISNAKGKFSINISAESGFTRETKISVSTNGELTNDISPVVAKNLGISQSKLQLNDNSLGIAQTMTFSPYTMQISDSGNSFAAELIDGQSGKVISSLGTGNFNVFSSKNNLNGSTFKYGDIISVYESKETSLSDHKIMLLKGKSKTYIDATGKFVSFEITPNGLVKLPNKSLTNVTAIYEGNSVVTVTGKTTENTNVTLSYGNDKSQVVKSNASGEFTTEIPVKDASIGSQVRVFLNNQNVQSSIVKYDTKIFNTNSSIQLINNEAFPVMNLSFSPAKEMIDATVYPRDKTYAGIFYGNKIDISLINPTTGAVIKNITSDKPQEIESFASQINNLKYTSGDILKIQYDNNFVSANVNVDKKEIGNTTGAAEYFEITDGGLKNISSKFINVEPLSILGNGTVTTAVIKGSIKANETITAMINGKSYKAVADADGKFAINVKDASGFKGKSIITLSADGYIPSSISPKMDSSLKIANSYVNFYKNTLNWETSGICSSIGFDTNNNTFTVNNYFDDFGTKSSNYFTLSLYNSNGQSLMSKSFTGEATSDLSTFINGKSFSYGDIIGLKYDASVYKPVIVNGNVASGNVTGQQEYFKITKDGLVRTQLSKSATSKVAPSKTQEKYTTIKNSSEIGSYLNKITNNLSSVNTASLSTNTSSQNKILAAEFINRIGSKNLEAFYNVSTKNASFINWVLNNSVAMQEFLSGSNPDRRYTPEGQPRATYSECLQVWSNIWNTYANSHDGFNLKLAIAVSLTNGRSIASFPSGKSVGNPVERYNIFETLNATGGMLPNFGTLDVSHLCFVTNTIIANDQIIPMRSIILQNHNGLITPSRLNDIAYTINYNLNNPHTGVSVFNNNFYGQNPTIKTVWYDGGVCGATGRMGASGEQVFGIPAVQTPQPGHNAFIYYNSDTNKWVIGNAVDGWANTYDADMSNWSSEISQNSSTVASYNILYQKADTKALKQSNLYVYLANSENGYTNKLASLNKAIELEPLNLGAWIKLVDLYKTNPGITVAQYNTLSSKIISTFKEYPMPMYDLLVQLKDVYLNNGTLSDFNAYVTNVENALNSEISNGYQTKVAKKMLGNMKNDGLFKGNKILLGNINIQNVWYRQIANISLNGVDKEVKVASSGSYTNPYGWGEAFEISLESSNGTVIKSALLNHQVSNAGGIIEKAFNNQKFEYGDKIVINYVSSSNITANNIVTENGKVPSYKVKNSVTTLYITQNGLSLTQSGQANEVSIPVTMKDMNGNIIGQATNIKGQAGMQIIDKNLAVPKGFVLEGLMLNGKSIYTGSSIANAKYALAQNRYTKSSSIEVLVKSIKDISGTVKILNNDNGTETVTFNNIKNVDKSVQLCTSENGFKPELMYTNRKGFWFVNINTPKNGESVKYYFIIDGKYKTKEQTYSIGSKIASATVKTNNIAQNSNIITKLPNAKLLSKS